jgi:hypothetical protein
MLFVINGLIKGEIEKWSVHWFDCDESLTCHGLNSNSGDFGGFTFIFVRVENHVYLSRGV